MTGRVSNFVERSLDIDRGNSSRADLSSKFLIDEQFYRGENTVTLKDWGNLLRDNAASSAPVVRISGVC